MIQVAGFELVGDAGIRTLGKMTKAAKTSAIERPPAVAERKIPAFIPVFSDKLSHK